jgi:hypothetical protein
MKIQLNAAARLAGAEITAVSKRMKPEMDKIFKALTRVLGTKYHSETHDGKEDVYWEFEGKRSRPSGGEHVLFAILYDPVTESMAFEVEGDELYTTSTSCKTAEQMIREIRTWARRSRSEFQVEKTLLEKLRKLY